MFIEDFAWDIVLVIVVILAITVEPKTVFAHDATERKNVEKVWIKHQILGYTPSYRLYGGNTIIFVDELYLIESVGEMGPVTRKSMK